MPPQSKADLQKQRAKVKYNLNDFLCVWACVCARAGQRFSGLTQSYGV